MGIERESRLGLDRMTPEQREAWHREHSAERLASEEAQRRAEAEAHRQSRPKLDHSALNRIMREAVTKTNRERKLGEPKLTEPPVFGQTPPTK